MKKEQPKKKTKLETTGIYSFRADRDLINQIKKKCLDLEITLGEFIQTAVIEKLESYGD